ncbi:transketolase [Novosphingobium barchaimii LL02]|uniref:Transketolase n=1 Tax=Novosphingobium barchaimii LL02 TaxID=1114963 RepID=A0A0J7Y5K0_9SPHN|nr:transketolase [Novosphingobium barchaimii]KMS59166.1 transketolase [Novosphingobium barchaimii LL02]
MTLSSDRLAPMANAIRALSMDAVQAANSGHPGMPMGMADVATVLFAKFLKFDPAAPKWADRDRFVLSAGHGSMLIYSLLHLTGYASPTLDDIRNFRQMGSVCAGHPENFLIEGVECTTGPLGQGVAMAVGMAMAERHLNATFGDDLVDHNTWVIAGDGCLMEGINHEAIGLAGTLKLGRLKVLWDNNKITIDGDTSLSTTEDIAARYRASGWDVFDCDGHDFADIERALAEAAASDKPSLVSCRTLIGKGAPNKQGGHDVHGSPLGTAEIEAAREYLGWTSAPFEIPAEIAGDWHLIGKRGTAVRADWEARLAVNDQAAEFTRRMTGELPEMDGIRAALAEWVAGDSNVATRKASENWLNVLAPAIPEMVGGSADLTGSNNTKAKCQDPFTPTDYAGRYVYYGIREFGMAAAMNGMALHGGVIPYGGTFLIFSDYCRNAIRLSALQQTRAIYVLTHDSIGLGEDGPTHQPVEHVMSMRLIPNLYVFRPADAVETAECWTIALESRETPSVLALTRQNLPQLRTSGDMLSARGAYTLRSAEGDRKVILIATGSEVELAVKVQGELHAQGIGADVVSMPCMELFAAQDEAYQREVLPNDPSVLRVSIEAGITQGWERYTAFSRNGGLNIGLDRFGASAPAKVLFERFGFTAEAIVPKILEKLST